MTRGTSACIASNRGVKRDGRDSVAVTLQRGSMLVEVLIAILIFSMGALALVGLQAATVKATTQAKYRSDASFVASQTLAQMWVDYANIPNYAGMTQPSTDQTTPASSLLPSGTRTIDVQTVADPPPSLDVGYDVTITVAWIAPGETSSPHQFITHSFLHSR